MEELPNHFLLELKNFFEQYKVLENKKVEIDNFQDQLMAYHIINEAISLYKETFKK
jgi:inorganic pyrophosphatase